MTTLKNICGRDFLRTGRRSAADGTSKNVFKDLLLVRESREKKTKDENRRRWLMMLHLADGLVDVAPQLL